MTRSEHRSVRLAVIVAAALLATGLAACGSEEAASVDTAAVSDTSAATDPVTEEAPAETDESTGISIDACSLPTDDELGAIFADGSPEGDGNDFGGGFGDCTWESDAAFVSVSIVPSANFASDFVDQLNVTGPVESPALGDGAVSFPGTVGIGSASGGGATIGFLKGDAGFLVAVRTGEEGAADDLAKATTLAEGIAGRL